MFVTEIGHGTMSVLAEDIHILIDPVLTDTFMAGVASTFPARELDLAALPAPDLVVVTHFHAGHLEPASLALLDRDVTLAVPDDLTVQATVRRLGFANVLVVAAGEHIEFGGVTVRFTGTGQSFPYVGILVSDESGTFWYMGDRGDTLSPDRIRNVVSSVGGIDVLVPSHPSDFHSFVLHSTCDGGAFEGESHARWVARSVEAIGLVSPRLALPQTTNFQYVGKAAWMNRYMFPMRPEEFTALAAPLLPDTTFDVLMPGDVVAIENRRPEVHRAAAPYVKTLATADPRGVEVTVPMPPVVDDDPDGLGDAELERRAHEYLRSELIPWLTDHRGGYSALIAAYRNCPFRFRLTVVLPSGAERSWQIAWTDGVPHVEPLLAGTAPSYNELHTRIAASTLDRWIREIVPYFAAAADTRRSGTLFDITRSANGRVFVEPVEARCLVSAHLMSDRVRLDRWLASEVDRAVAGSSRP